jgi:hypothetical protein
LIPGFDGALFSPARRKAPWARFFTAAPLRKRRSVERYNESREPEDPGSPPPDQPEDAGEVEEAEFGCRTTDGPKHPKFTVLTIEKEAMVSVR